jgi:hypothetical protein
MAGLLCPSPGVHLSRCPSCQAGATSRPEPGTRPRWDPGPTALVGVGPDSLDTLDSGTDGTTPSSRVIPLPHELTEKSPCFLTC